MTPAEPECPVCDQPIAEVDSHIILSTADVTVLVHEDCLGALRR